MANKTMHHVVIGGDTFELIDEAGREETASLKEDINELGGIIKDYENIAAKMPSVLNSNNAKFCENFGRIVDELMKEK